MKVELLKDQFTDYLGKTHHFIIAGVSVTYDDSLEVLTAKGVQSDFWGYIDKGLHIGIAICNPNDKYDEKLGVRMAIGRAKQSNAAIYVTDLGYINTKMVRALLTQEAEYLKSNPGKYITGYSESEKRYQKRKDMEVMKENFSELENQILEKLHENPKFLNNVYAYLKWISYCG